MTFFQFRQLIESSVPWWLPFVLPVSFPFLFLGAYIAWDWVMGKVWNLQNPWSKVRK